MPYPHAHVPILCIFDLTAVPVMPFAGRVTAPGYRLILSVLQAPDDHFMLPVRGSTARAAFVFGGRMGVGACPARGTRMIKN
jgi:hypothetical protein